VKAAHVGMVLIGGLTAGSIAAWMYWANQNRPPDSPPPCPSPDVAVLPNTGGICPVDYVPDPNSPGCCEPLGG
jgi:hypothetical protein